MSTAIVWFRRDLRLTDQPALSAALARHEHAIPLYIHAPAEEGEWAPGGAQRWWPHHSLKALADSRAAPASSGRPALRSRPLSLGPGLDPC